jgi:predicted short-subunit dehydrogenase-like oxidoreductase (DUF2520 family)
MREPVFLIALAIAAGTVLMVVKTIAGAFTGKVARGDLSRLLEESAQHAAALEDAEATLAHQAQQIAELQERIDFTERLLAMKDRGAVGPGS